MQARRIFASGVYSLLISAETTLSTHCILQAVGVGNITALTVSANYMIRDIGGQLGGMWYINRNPSVDNVGKTCNSINTWFTVANTAECLTPMLAPLGLSAAFIPLTMTTNMIKNVSYVRYGTLNTVIISKASEQEAPLLGSMGDELDATKTQSISTIYSRLSISNTIGTSLGTMAGLGIIWLLPDNTERLAVALPLAVARWWWHRRFIAGEE
jgi:hypothetical protein